MWKAPFYHDGMRLIQDRFDGRRLADALERNFLHETLHDRHIRLIQTASHFFIATAAGEFVDCSMKCGTPGFIQICGPSCIEYPEYDGNSMYRTIGNLLLNGNCGLLFTSTEAPTQRLRAMGEAIVLGDPETLARHRNAKLVIRIDCRFFPNCSAKTELEQDPHIGQEGQGQLNRESMSWKSIDFLKSCLPGSGPK
jgi:predicted pyridoxine 5'-phosphate oxidase superfamily flavin-nucleotide-binding protein